MMICWETCIHNVEKESPVYDDIPNKNKPPAGLEPAIPGLGGRCLIHWATEATDS